MKELEYLESLRAVRVARNELERLTEGKTGLWWPHPDELEPEIARLSELLDSIIQAKEAVGIMRRHWCSQLKREHRRKALEIES